MEHSAKTVAGPANWFECQIPSGWCSLSESDCLRIFSPDGTLQICIEAFWHTAKNVAPIQILDPNTIFPNAFGLRKLAPLRIPRAASYGFEGSYADTEGITFWQRLFWPSRKRKWQAWAVRCKSVCLVCTAEQLTETLVPQAMTDAAREILGSIEFTEHPAATPEAFATNLLSRAKRRFDVPAERVGGLKLAIGGARVNLLTFYRAYQHNPASLDEISESVLSTVERLLSWDAGEIEDDFESVQDRVMPMLVPQAVWEDSLTEFVSEPWIAGLRILFVVDEQDAYWYVRDSLLEKWQVSLEELHRLALTNLAEYFEQSSIDMTAVDGANGPKLLMPTNADAYNSVQLLNQPFHRKLQRILGPEFAVGIPNRDFFVAVSLKNTEVLERVRGKVASDFQTMDHPLTDRLLIVSTDGVSEYCDPE